MWRGLAVVVLVLTGVALLPQSASACSCALLDPREMLGDGDAAFVGALIHKEKPSGGIFDVTYTFEIEQALKGDLGETVEVESPPGGGACGFEVEPGQRIGVILYRDGDRWTGGLCSTVPADALIRAAQPIPPPDGEGPVALLMPNPTGDAEIVALDAQGRVLAYGESEVGSQVERMSVCPGSERVVFEGHFPHLAVHNLRTMQVERILRPDGLVSRTIAMECLTPDGEAVLLYQMNHLENGGEVSLIRVQGEDATVIYEAVTGWLDYNSVALDPERNLAYIVDPENRFQVLAIDLLTGESRVVVQIVEPEGDRGGIYQMAINPTGTDLAVLVEVPAFATYPNLFLIDLTAEPAISSQVGTEDDYFYGTTWVADDRLMVNGSEINSQDVLIYDSSGALVRTIANFWLDPVTTRGGVVYGVGHRTGASGMFPSLFSITLPDGEPEAIRPIDRPYVHTLVAVPDDIQVEAAPVVNPTEREAAESPTSESTPTHADSTATRADSTAPPADVTATPLESGQVGGEGDPPVSDGAVASTGSGPGIGTAEMAVGGLVLGVVTLGGWLVLRRRRHPQTAAEPRT